MGRRQCPHHLKGTSTSLAVTLGGQAGGTWIQTRLCWLRAEGTEGHVWGKGWFSFVPRIFSVPSRHGRELAGEEILVCVGATGSSLFSQACVLCVSPRREPQGGWSWCAGAQQALTCPPLTPKAHSALWRLQLERGALLRAPGLLGCCAVVLVGFSVPYLIMTALCNLPGEAPGGAEPTARAFSLPDQAPSPGMQVGGAGTTVVYRAHLSACLGGTLV